MAGMDTGRAHRLAVPFRGLKALFPDLLKDRVRIWLLWRKHARYIARRARAKQLPAGDRAGVNLLSFRDHPLGLAEAARSSARALAAAAIPYVCLNVAQNEFRLGRTRRTEAARGLPYGINLCHANAAQAGILVELCGPARFAPRYNIGYWAWELNRFPRSWDLSRRYFDEIWCLSTFTRDAVARGTRVPVLAMPCCIAVQRPAGDWRTHFGIPAGRPAFLCMCDIVRTERKNQLAALRAFRAAIRREDRAVLVVKVVARSGDASIMSELRAELQGLDTILIDRHISRRETWGLLSACDAYVSLHRGEGYGLILAEAMALGKPVVATGYSGNMEFMTAANSFPVDFRLVKIEREIGPFPKGFEWAEPDLDDAARQIRTILDLPQRAKEVGGRAAEDIARNFSPAAIGRRYRARLETLGLIGD